MGAIRGKIIADKKNLGVATFYTQWIDIGDLSRLAAFFEWLAATTATIRAQTSNDVQQCKRDNHQALWEGANGFSSDANAVGKARKYQETILPPLDPAGAAASVMWHISELNSSFVRFVVTVSATASDWYFYLSAKE